MDERERLENQLILGQGAGFVAEKVINLPELFQHFQVTHLTVVNVLNRIIWIRHSSVRLDPESVNDLL